MNDQSQTRESFNRRGKNKQLFQRRTTLAGLNADDAETARLGSCGQRFVVGGHHEIGMSLFTPQESRRQMDRVQRAQRRRERLRRAA